MKIPKDIHWKDPGDDGRNKLRFLMVVERLYNIPHSFQRLHWIVNGAIASTSEQVWMDEDGNGFYIEGSKNGSK